MKLYPICSSSKGNSTYIGTKEKGIAIDMGCSYKAFRDGLSLIGAEIASVKAVLITHEHIDHVKGLLTLTKKTQTPIYAAEPVLSFLLKEELVTSTANLHTLDELEKIAFDAEIKSFPTPHDAASSVGYVLDFGKTKLGFCTDLGHVTEEVEKSLTGCRTVFVEANYRPEMLQSNPHYPPVLKRRIAGPNGHLSNNDSAEFCGRLIKKGTINFTLGHLSQENNTPETAFNAVREHLANLGAEYEKDYLLKVAPVMNMDGDYISF
ncbi:MAG: MBL fold metallo-hydrolase [Ruminococcaceae bacterium]|nr:MBL fold metallo-hydrolase [Oscillospiraceae bacterium]